MILSYCYGINNLSLSTKLKKTKVEGGKQKNEKEKIKERKRRYNPSSFGGNHSSIVNISRNKLKFNIRTKWNNNKSTRCKRQNSTGKSEY